MICGIGDIPLAFGSTNGFIDDSYRTRRRCNSKAVNPGVTSRFSPSATDAGGGINVIWPGSHGPTAKHRES